MRRRNVGAAGLALGLGLCVAGIALGQEPAGGGGSWFSRLFSHGNAAPAPKDQKEEKVVPMVSPAVVRAQALSDYLRRIEVCLKLQEIGLANGDNELLRKADQLEQRARDIYDQRVNASAGSPSNLDEQLLANKLAPKQGGLTPLSAATGKSQGGQASAGVRP